MSDLVMIFGLALKIGTVQFPGAQTYEWEIYYPQLDQSVFYTTTNGQQWLEFQPRLGWMLRSRVRLPGGAWSDWSSDFVVNPLEGDLDGDCVVGGSDVAELAHNWGRICP